MSDLYFSEDGDLRIAVNGDVAVTPSESRNVAQQIYLRVMTELGDFPIYRNLGAQLDKLVGMPQSPSTGAYGQQLIQEALQRDGKFQGRAITVKPVPTGRQTLRFDIYTLMDNKNSLILSVEQDLGVA